MIFDERTTRLPIEYPWVVKYIESIWRSHWVPIDFSFVSDIKYYHTCDDQTRGMLLRSLSAIAQIEVSVKRFWSNYLPECLPKPEFADLGITMGHTEVIHNNAYERLLTLLGLEDQVQNILKADPVIVERNNYLRKHLQFAKDLSLSKEQQFILALAVFSLYVENVSLFSQFYIIQALSRDNFQLKDLPQQIAYTQIEEQLHANIGFSIYNQIRVEYPELIYQVEGIILDAAREFYEFEKRFIVWVLGDYSRGLITTELVTGYALSRINDSLSKMGLPSIAILSEDQLKGIQWMNTGLVSNTDFFFKDPVGYNEVELDANDLF